MCAKVLSAFFMHTHGTGVTIDMEVTLHAILAIIRWLHFSKARIFNRAC